MKGVATMTINTKSDTEKTVEAADLMRTAALLLRQAEGCTKRARLMLRPYDAPQLGRPPRKVETEEA
jgi:hypothetical protein